MGVIIIREMVGTSPQSWSDAARQAVATASKTVRNIQTGEVVKSSAVVEDGQIGEYRVDVKIHNRVMFVIAEAGYGKTTLLADFSRRTHLRTLWYRMDAEDRSWGSFLSYLIAAGREYEPDFAQRTAAMLRESEPGGPTRDEVVDVFLRELPAISEDGAAVILDDFHVADDVPDIRFIARELVARAPERLTIVFSSRRVPAIPVGRLRSHG